MIGIKKDLKIGKLIWINSKLENKIMLTYFILGKL